MIKYDDLVRRRDAEYLMRNADLYLGADKGLAMRNALATFLLDSQIRPILEAIDPQAVHQARKALGLQQ